MKHIEPAKPSDDLFDQLAASGVTPTIIAALDDVGTSKGMIQSGRTTDDNRPQLMGQAGAGSIVSIYDNGVLIGQTEADSNGNWTFTTPTLSNSEHSLTVSADGYTSAPLDFIVNDGTGPVTPYITSALDDVGDSKGMLLNGRTTDDNQP
ncbi:hypothetical protein IFT80_21060, partial [Pseudomonas sp. CFBP 8771]|uniref:Ig-like domain-containing protein n=1 Tax=Pseudomonas sp. CFBP 8771 TaxID=2775285 RepID=UPI00177B4B68